jgi:hypothetical protein
MTKADKFMLSGKSDIDGNQRKSRNFKAVFYRRPINGATRNHTDRISNFPVDKLGYNNGY